jgi:hypothetical protein
MEAAILDGRATRTTIVTSAALCIAWAHSSCAPRLPRILPRRLLPPTKPPGDQASFPRAGPSSSFARATTASTRATRHSSPRSSPTAPCSGGETAPWHGWRFTAEAIHTDHIGPGALQRRIRALSPIRCCRSRATRREPGVRGVLGLRRLALARRAACACAWTTSAGSATTTFRQIRSSSTAWKSRTRRLPNTEFLGRVLHPAAHDLGRPQRSQAHAAARGLEPVPRGTP